MKVEMGFSQILYKDIPDMIVHTMVFVTPIAYPLKSNILVVLI